MSPSLSLSLFPSKMLMVPVAGRFDHLHSVQATGALNVVLGIVLVAGTASSAKLAAFPVPLVALGVMWMSCAFLSWASTRRQSAHRVPIAAVFAFFTLCQWGIVLCTFLMLLHGNERGGSDLANVLWQTGDQSAVQMTFQCERMDACKNALRTLLDNSQVRTMPLAKQSQATVSHP